MSTDTATLNTYALDRARAIARLNNRQQSRNLFTNIGEREVAREIKRERKQLEREYLEIQGRIDFNG